MHPAIRDMLVSYNCQNPNDYKNALKEIIQDVALLGLSRQNFFKHAAFYGGTALRIAHGLGRFSEDMDFTLCSPDQNFDLSPYLKGLEDELSSFGLQITAEKKEKTHESTVDSAFLKGNTLLHMLMIEGLENPRSGTQKNETLKIKLEIDIDPPSPAGDVIVKFHHNPIPFEYKTLTLPSLYAGKLHALLFRQWRGGRVKGRDFYDFIWYRNKKIDPDMPYLEAKIRQTGTKNFEGHLTHEKLNDLLKEKFDRVDWEQAKRDVTPFIKDSFALNVWSASYFKSLL